MTTAVGKSDHEVLTDLVRAQGLFEKQPAYYRRTFVTVIVFIGLSGAVLFFPEGFYLAILGGLLWAFTSTLIGMLGHDLGHRQVFETRRYNDLVMLAFSGFIGLSPEWWRSNHNAHHENPNNLKEDPHTNIPGMSFSEEQAAGKIGLSRFLLRFQAPMFFLLLFFESFGTMLASALQVKKKYKYVLAERVVVFGHLILYPVLILSALSVWEAAVFFAVHQGTLGLYLGLIFAPNHKGMEILTKDSHLDSLRKQILTSRNIRGGLVTDFLMGGLNYQIEHHLFTDMPRCNLRKASQIVREFCESRGISYKEVNIFQSYAEVFTSMNHVAKAAA